MFPVAFAAFQAKDYELRQYETAKWVSTVIREEPQKEAMRQGFWKLFHYIQGKNEKGTKGSQLQEAQKGDKAE